MLRGIDQGDHYKVIMKTTMPSNLMYPYSFLLYRLLFDESNRTRVLYREKIIIGEIMQECEKNAGMKL